MLQFKKRRLSDEKYEACAVFDVNGDGIPDIVSGAYWYEGPDYAKKHFIGDVLEISEYHDDFSDYPMDVDGDGRLDIITGAWWGETLRWRRNPGEAGATWETIDVDKCGSIETIRYYDIDGCGVPEIFPNTPGMPQSFYKLVRDADGKGIGVFLKYTISEGASGHGMGFVDVNGDGRMDIVLAGGWLEQPEDPFAGLWTFHPEFSLGSASVPVLGHDVNGDGLIDLIVGQAHDYGLHWYEQGRAEDGSRTWKKHEIDMSGSQFHDLWLVDLDLDGELELITGKRYRAHNDGDPGAHDPIGLYYYKINGGAFKKHVIDFGPAGEASGAGIYFWVQDLTGNGYPDIVAPGKDGLYLFQNHGRDSEA
ncbi:FG-GAP repeat domain-containing protein [Paenibacillus silvisoli]|uniref:FG-GAP repeat domain-containing protein n=1 Tax=Paenibacillus silvisoli TaxID=3110539 RepID=UPI002803F9A6|nr:VCBS repeat-containing protein [Paenibacillus silvisoli]